MTREKYNAIIYFLILAVVILGGGLYKAGQKINDLEKDLADYKTTYLSRSGWTAYQDYGSYQLQSLDGGRTWYAVEYQEDGVVKVLGNADSLYPGLVENIEAFDALFKYVEENGPIGSRPITSEDLKFLEDAGFTVEKSGGD